MSSFPMTQLGPRAFNHNQSRDTEAEYDRLRGLARQEHDKRSACLDKAHQAYERGDGAAAHQFSQEGKKHGELMDQYNQQARDFIFRENNAVGRVDGDTIDLHGLYQQEAEDILEERIRYARSTGQTHLHVIVGKGNHSVDHIQKIKPRVEQVCQELGLQYTTEANAGRMYINLQGGPATMPAYQQGGAHTQQNNYNAGPQYQSGQQYQQPYQQQSQYQQSYPSQQNTYGGGQQQQGNDQVEEVVKKVLPKILHKFGCCTVM